MGTLLFSASSYYLEYSQYHWESTKYSARMKSQQSIHKIPDSDKLPSVAFSDSMQKNQGYVYVLLQYSNA
jgi:hypothetical protein